MELEICVETLEAALLAAKAGATRIELCQNVAVGGLTPLQVVLQQCIAQLTIPVYPIIRPRAGNYVYTKAEILEMVHSIEDCKKIGCSGIVLGALLPNNTIDVATTKQMVKVANGVPVTFHKAIDSTPNALQSLQQIIDCGCTNILTSGLATTAMQGVATLRQLVQKAGNYINIIVAGNVRSHNIAMLKAATSATHFHSKVVNDVSNKFSEEQSIRYALEIENMVEQLM